jgi:hypothetical protein
MYFLLINSMFQLEKQARGWAYLLVFPTLLLRELMSLENRPRENLGGQFFIFPKKTQKKHCFQPRFDRTSPTLVPSRGM